MEILCVAFGWLLGVVSMSLALGQAGKLLNNSGGSLKFRSAKVEPTVAQTPTVPVPPLPIDAINSPGGGKFRVHRKPRPADPDSRTDGA